MQLAFLSLLFDTDDFPPRWMCGNFTELHGWTHIIADCAIFGAYAAIPCVITYFVLKRRDVELPSLWWLFAAFIFACGFGHLVEASLFWQPWYRLSALVKVCTAVVSWATVLALAHYLPVALTMPGVARLNEQLRGEIEERARTERSLRESEERFRALVSAASQIVWTTNADGQVEEDSPTWRAFTGQSYDQWKGWGWIDALHPLDRGPVQRLWRDTVKRQEPIRTEYRIHHTSGEWRWMVVNSVPWCHADGSVRGWVGMNTDITERKLAERKLAEERQLLRTLIDNLPGCIFVKDTAGRYLISNLSHTRLLGAKAESELVGRTVFDFQPAETARQYDADDKAVLETSQPVIEREELAEKDGQRTWHQVTKVPVHDSQNNIIALVGIKHDITGRKLAENAMRASLAEKETLLKEVHHRVKNNMQVISSILMLQSPYLRDPADREMFTECQDRVRTMALVHEKLYRSQNLASIDFGEHIRELSEMLMRSHGRASANVRMEVSTDSAVLDIDTAIPLGLILNELLTNTFKYAFPQGREGRIEVALRWQGGEKIVLTVADNGAGLPAGFDIDKADSLGLQMVKVLCRQVRGKMSVDRTDGTRFAIVVPVCPAHEKAIADSPGADSLASDASDGGGNSRSRLDD